MQMKADLDPLPLRRDSCLLRLFSKTLDLLILFKANSLLDLFFLAKNTSANPPEPIKRKI